MARLASQQKMGFYPTPEKTLEAITWRLCRKEGTYSKRRLHLLDPCCGEGMALYEVQLRLGGGSYYGCKSWGIELDVERAAQASQVLNEVVQGSIFNTKIEPEGAFGLLWLNPPYDTAWNGEREEMLFLKHCVRWLCTDGVLVFIVPEHILMNEKHRIWIASYFKDCAVYRIVRDEFPTFKQAILIGRKKGLRSDAGDLIPAPPYPYIDEANELPFYEVPLTEGPAVFEGEPIVSDEEIKGLREEVKGKVEGLFKDRRLRKSLSPMFPLRKGHLVSLITAGFLNGRVLKPGGGFILMRGYSERQESVRIEEDREITTSTYRVGIRVIDPDAGRWYDIT